MNRRACTALIALLALGGAGAAVAREPYDDLFFVKRGASATQMLTDRRECRRRALSIGETSAAYSDPQYGALAAMGQVLDSDALHSGGLRQRMEKAILENCMKGLGWTPLQPSGADARAVRRASLKKPEALDAWLEANAPPEVVPPVAANEPPK